MSGREVRGEVTRLLELVGLHRDHANRFPHEFSGGQRQRIGIARALAVNPEFIVCDEPISSLDVSIQAQIVNTLEDLQNQLGLTYLFIAHDISMVKHISRRIAVMYLGVIVELGESDRLYRNPQHPYTQALLSAVPVPDPDLTRAKERIVLEGDVPSPIEVPQGCRFRGRCRFAMPKCAEAEPALTEVEPGYHVACYLVHDVAADGTTNTGTETISPAPSAGPELTEAPTAGGGRGKTNTEGDRL
jgi:oligopeptide transport system ATP-binding protein